MEAGTTSGLTGGFGRDARAVRAVAYAAKVVKQTYDRERFSPHSLDARMYCFVLFVREYFVGELDLN